MTEKKKHLYAEILRAIADGLLIEWQETSTKGIPQDHSMALREIALETYIPQMYRIKPRTITIGKYEVVEPMKVAPENGERYWFITAPQAGQVQYERWYGTTFDKEVLKSGMCWLKREDAELAAKAITELLTGKSA